MYLQQVCNSNVDIRITFYQPFCYFICLFGCLSISLFVLFLLSFIRNRTSTPRSADRLPFIGPHGCRSITSHGMKSSGKLTRMFTSTSRLKHFWDVKKFREPKKCKDVSCNFKALYRGSLDSFLHPEILTFLFPLDWIFFWPSWAV